VYLNIQVHDEACRMIRTQEKKQIQEDIEEQMELGFDGFVAMDRSLALVSLGRIWNPVVVISKSTGYWL